MTSWLLDEGALRTLREARRLHMRPSDTQALVFQERVEEVARAETPRIMEVAGATAEIRIEGILTKAPDILAYDLAVCLNAWCFEKDHSFNHTKGRALVSGYAAVRPLSAAEAEALPILSRGAALRFMLTRLYDWLTVADGSLVMKKDPMEYVRRMRFHESITSPAEYGLEAPDRRP